jgi:putative Mg2+ transporter-C (MgtC) family protein
MAYVVSGIGFLGAGAIMKEGVNIRGLNTAATLWCSAAVGAASGAGLIAEAILLTLFVLAGNTLLRPIVNAINRIPVDETASEATYEVRMTTSLDAAAEARETLLEGLDSAHYPVSHVKTEDRGDETVDVIATLVSTSIVPAELDAVVAKLGERADVEHATWESVVKG